MDLPDPPLLVISDRSQVLRPLLEIAEAAFAGGCRWFSLREKDLPPAERGELLVALVRLGRRFGATVMAHEDIEAVAAAGAGGVHLPAGGDPRAARLRLPGALIGASAHSGREAASLLRAGADYVTVSPVFIERKQARLRPGVGARRPCRDRRQGRRAHHGAGRRRRGQGRAMPCRRRTRRCGHGRGDARR